MVGSHGTTAGTGCAQLGVFSNGWLDGILQSTVMPALDEFGRDFAQCGGVFLFCSRMSCSPTPILRIPLSCCILGYHSAVGTPVQTYGAMDWDTSGNFGTSVSDASITSHEIAEWMDDPLANNSTPPWGNVGQVSGCQNDWEVGDPLSGTLMPRQ